MRAYSSGVGPRHLLRVIMVLALSICVASPGSIASATTAGRSSAAIVPFQGGFVLDQVLYAPLYFAYGGYEPVVYVFNRSNATVGVELDLDPTAPVTIGSPFLASVAPGKVVTVNLVDYLTLTDPDETLVVGGLRLRHDGADANAISAVLSVDNNGFDRAFSIAFTAAGTPDPATEQQQYAMAHLGQDRTCTLAVQNTSDTDTWVEPTVYYETSAGSPPAPIVLPALDVEVGRTNVIDLTSYLTAFDASASQRQWGVIKLRSPKNTIVARAVTTQSEPAQIAFDSAFADPAVATGVAKVLTPIALDYKRASKTYVFVRNLATASRTVTAKLVRSAGTTTYTLNLGAGRQTLLTLDSQTILPPNGIDVADLRLTYSGAPSDVIATAVSESTTSNLAVPARLVEPSPNDARRLVGPTFELSGSAKTALVVSNLSAASIKVGARMYFTDGTAASRTSDLVAVPANGRVVLDLLAYINQIPDDVDGIGAVELWHNGPAGALAASALTVGRGLNIAQTAAFSAFDQIPSGELVAFPNAITATPGSQTTIRFLVDFGIPTPTVETVPASGAGSVTSPVADGTNVYKTTYTAPTSFNAPGYLVQARSSSGQVYPASPVSVGVAYATLDLAKFRTFDANGNDLHKRMSPIPGTTFFSIGLTGSSQFPVGTYKVEFKSGSKKVFKDNIQLMAPSETIEAEAPPNEAFIGDVKTITVLKDGAKYTKGQDLGAYYAYDPPTPTGITPSSHNRSPYPGAEVSGSGFHAFEPAQGSTVFPIVAIGGVGFKVTAVPSEFVIQGKIQRADNKDVDSCNPPSACKKVRVIPAGGKELDKVDTDNDVYTLVPGPDPVLQTVSDNSVYSVGGEKITLNGQILWNHTEITLNGKRAPVDRTRPRTATSLTIKLPPNLVGSYPIVLYDLDDRPFTSSFTIRYEGTPITPETTDIPASSFSRSSTTVGQVSRYYLTGPSEYTTLEVFEGASGNILNSDYTVVAVPAGLPQLSHGRWQVVFTIDARNGTLGTKLVTFKLRSTEDPTVTRTVSFQVTITQ